MTHRASRGFCTIRTAGIAAALLLTTLQAWTQTTATAPAAAASGTVWVPAPDWLNVTVVVVVFVFALLSILVIRASLMVSSTGWSLADALSEEVELTAWDRTKTPPQPLLDANQQPVKVVEMRASASRVIAFMGMIVIMLMFLGFGVLILHSFAKTGSMPDSVGDLIKFLLAGLTLFAPYAVNKFASLFEGLTPRK